MFSVLERQSRFAQPLEDVLGMRGLEEKELFELLPRMIGEIRIDGEEFPQRVCGRVPIPELPIHHCQNEVGLELPG
jgi:hypothetical protein